MTKKSLTADNVVLFLINSAYKAVAESDEAHRESNTMLWNARRNDAKHDFRVAFELAEHFRINQCTTDSIIKTYIRKFQDDSGILDEMFGDTIGIPSSSTVLKFARLGASSRVLSRLFKVWASKGGYIEEALAVAEFAGRNFTMNDFELFVGSYDKRCGIERDLEGTLKVLAVEHLSEKQATAIAQRIGGVHHEKVEWRRISDVVG